MFSATSATASICSGFRRSSKGRRVYPTEVLLASGTGGLTAASLVLAHQVRALSARRLSPAIGSIGDTALPEHVATALRLWLDPAGNGR
jgi:mRNA-degrading endonuclease toxin of MazEF toxin-antitoxin module